MNNDIDEQPKKKLIPLPSLDAVRVRFGPRCWAWVGTARYYDVETGEVTDTPEPKQKPEKTGG